MSLLLLFNGGATVHASASIIEADDAITASVSVLVSLSASLTEADDLLTATASNGTGVVSVGLGGAGGYVRRVRTKPKKPLAKPKPKPLPELVVRLAAREQDDAVAAAGTVDGQSLAAAALALAAKEQAKRMVEHDNDFWMAA